VVFSYIWIVKTKEKIGLVLSGGGTKGVAHAGVIQFLNEKKMKPSTIACCSAGAIVAAMFALGKKPKEILSLFEKVNIFSWKHLLFNKPGLISDSIFNEYLIPILGNKKIGDLPIQLKIVATEMISGKQIVFDDNFNLLDAIIASCSIPGISIPYIVEEKVYCDGGVLNNFPADIIREDCNKIIGVFLSPLQPVTLQELGSIKSVISRSYDLLSYRTEQYKFAYCDWFISSQKFAKYGTFEKKASRLQELFDIGYQTANETFPNWGCS
jgi:NTE family protein